MKFLNTSGKRKSAIARAAIKAGSGIIKINGRLIEFHEPMLSRLRLQEPLMLAGEQANSVDINVKIKGGGTMSQTEAARLAIAKALVGFAKDKKLEKSFLEYDRHLLVADVRRREVRKPNTHGKARAKRQKSYR
ncbi:30S ribosomal protein S9 [Candidatus Woesearchaeota archaeon]|nr:30S ribosomal protein S9 [Candidatus Woesearchaeota archaeon]